MWDVLEVCQIRKVNTGQQDEKVNKSALYAFNELPYSSSLYKISIDFFFDPQQ